MLFCVLFVLLLLLLLLLLLMYFKEFVVVAFMIRKNKTIFFIFNDMFQEFTTREFRETRAIAPARAPARALARLNYFRRAVGRTRKTIASHS